MATKRVNPCQLVESDGVLSAFWQRFTVRFLLSDGRTVDVVTDRDDSDLRQAVLDRFKVERIEGSTRLGTTEGVNTDGKG